MTAAHYAWLANLTLALHVLLVVFVALMVPLAWLGRWRKWAWTGNRWLRGIHLLLIAFIAVQTWLGQVCPLTVWELWFRRQAGQEGYDKPFIQHWLERALYHSWPGWVFVAIYSGFFGLVVLTLWVAPVRWRVKSSAP